MRRALPILLSLVAAPLIAARAGALPAAQALSDMRSWTIYFDQDSDLVTPEAAAILDSIVETAAADGGARFMLEGHTDRAGTVAYNQARSQRMAANVEAYLVGRRIAPSRITTIAYGESHPAVPTAYGVREPQNRRVVISLHYPTDSTGNR